MGAFLWTVLVFDSQDTLLVITGSWGISLSAKIPWWRFQRMMETDFCLNPRGAYVCPTSCELEILFH